MNRKNGDEPEALEAPIAGSPIALRSLSSKRQLSDATQQRSLTCRQQATKRGRADAADFANPWRCDSAPYTPLPITYHKPKYNPPCYFDENLNHLPSNERVLKIMAYHYALSGEMSAYARTQPRSAPLGDPINGSQLFNGALEKRKAATAIPESVIDKEEPYVSRSGRHVKRRQNFSAYDIMDDEDEKEKEKTLKKAKLDETYKTPPTVKRAAKKMTNEEIMSRSSLFADSPMTNKSSRTQAMFSKMEEADKENKKAEAEKRKFEMTLEQFSDDDLELISSSNENLQAAEESDFLPKRIKPPLPQRKYTDKQSGHKYKEMPSTSTAASPTKNGNGSSTPIPANKRGPKKKITNCPICGESFPTKEIIEHASTCGLTSELEIESSIPNQRADATRY